MRKKAYFWLIPNPEARQVMGLVPSRRRFWRNCGIIGLGLTSFRSRALAYQPQSTDQAIASIRAVLESQEAAWNKGDLDAFLAGYWNSPRVVFQSGGNRYDGWEAMRDRYRARYKAEGKAMGRVSFTRIEIEPLGPLAALVRGAWRLNLPDGAHPGGLFTLIFRRFPDGWKIVHDHTSAEDPGKTSV
jgi:beta-aspartyl-peptidase (threonine type)